MDTVKRVFSEEHKKNLSEATKKWKKERAINKLQIELKENGRICIDCKRKLTIDSFSKCNGRNDGLMPYCKECSSKRYLDWHHRPENAQKHILRKKRNYSREKNRIEQANKLKKIRSDWAQWLINNNMDACSKCGYDKNFAAIEFHHTDKDSKKFSPAQLINKKRNKQAEAELLKTICVCSRCHREILHANFGSLKDFLLST